MSFHTHSEFCDGEGTPEEMVRAAVEAGIPAVGLSSHAPLPFETEWTMPPERLDAYVAEWSRLREQYAAEIDVLLGMEIDYLPGEAVSAFQRQILEGGSFQYLIGAVHFLGAEEQRELDGTEEKFVDILEVDYRGNIRAMVSDFYTRVSCIPSMPGVTVVAHLDLIKRWNHSRSYFTGEEPWYREAAEAALHVLARSGLIVELNSAGWRKELGEPYPSVWLLERCRDLAIPVMINSDAHRPEDVVAGFAEARDLLQRIGIQPVTLPFARGALRPA